MITIKAIKNQIIKGILTASYIVLGFAVGIIIFALAIPAETNADLPTGFSVSNLVSTPKLSNGSLTICKLDKSDYEVVKTVKMVITAYSSTPDQTDDSPFITASNKRVADGIIANNLLPFGTKVRIPELYGDKIFVVEDRMNKRKGNYHADIWMEETHDAINFGAKVSYIEVIES
jgi:3D (Asp-Asp-Asp) domain-containing protein